MRASTSVIMGVAHGDTPRLKLVIITLTVSLCTVSYVTASESEELGMTARNGTENVFVTTVTDDKYRSLNSEFFPGCCWPIKFVMQRSESDSEIEDGKHWKVRFTDLDIPYGSQMLIYLTQGTGETLTKNKVTLSWYTVGSHTFPGIYAKANAISIEFIPPKNLLIYTNQKYNGFKAQYWLDADTPWQYVEPIQTCPELEAKHIQRVALHIPSTAAHRKQDESFRLNCIWEFMPPPPLVKIQSYVKLEHFSQPYTSLTIRRGLTLLDPRLVTLKRRQKRKNLFVSDSGFHISLSRPLAGGEFKMAVGVFRPTFADGLCEFKIDDQRMDGFVCDNSSTPLCIPLENTCNDINDCRSKRDENQEYCKKPAEKPVTEHCGLFKKQCPDGTCVLLLSSCPEVPTTTVSNVCGLFKKQCRDDSCLSMEYKCPEETCQAEFPFDCGDECMVSKVRCNFQTDCSSGADEEGCSIVEYLKGENGKYWMILLALIPIAILSFALYRLSCRWLTKTVNDDHELESVEPTTDRNTDLTTPNTTLLPNMVTNEDMDPPPRPTYANLDEDDPLACRPVSPPSYNEVIENQAAYPRTEVPPPTYSAVSEA